MPPKPLAKWPSKQRAGDDDNAGEYSEGHDDYIPGMENKQILKPENQLKLTEAELKEEITQVLTANNPHAPHNIVRWNFKESQYKALTNVEQIVIHFSMDSNLIHSESDEAKNQILLYGDEDATSEKMGSTSAASVRSVARSATRSHSSAHVKASKSDVDLEDEDVPEEKEETSDSKVDVAVKSREASPAPSQENVGAPKRAPKEKKLTNQFNFSERGSQTYNFPFRDRSTITEPPPRANFSGMVTQWEIYDSYQEDFAKQQAEKLKEQKKATIVKKEVEVKKKKSNLGGELMGDSIEMIAPAVKILERMVNQNTFDDISQDFKYYEDQSDEFRDQEGSLLPLWTFTLEKVKKMAITSLCWSSRYMDLFGVSHGSYDYTKPRQGVLLLYTLKNPSYPEYILDTTSGIMSLDIHPEYPYLIALGFFDGNVGVYNIIENKDQLACISSSNTNKHTDMVWQVKWQPEDLDGNLNFYSLSSDGVVVAWTLIKNELGFQKVIHLVMKDLITEGPNGTQLITLGSGVTFDFHPKKEHLFLVGTQEGKVHFCSKYHAHAFIDTYNAHHMAIYRVSWNPYHPKIFITCSEDWTIKIWDQTTNSREPLFTFDLGSSVGDVAWAPYSSTVFAAVTADGKVCVYDLNINKFEPLCEQVLTSKKRTKLTHVAFNPRHPIIIASDDRGSVICLKLSPNLRKKPKEKKGQEQPKPEEKEAMRIEYEYQKLEKLLGMVRQVDENAKRKPAAPNAPTKATEAKKE